MAVLLGPAGVGLAGLYGSISDLTQNIAGMGINSSGVRQIAAAVASNDIKRIAQTAAVLRWTSIVLGVLGALLLILFSRQVSSVTFGGNQNAGAICLLSLAVLFRLISGGQGALIQGLRRISDLAEMNVLGAVLGTVVSIPIVYIFRVRGVVPSLVLVAGMTIATSWWYSRKVSIPAPSITPSQVGREAASLLKLGFAFMSSGLMTMGAAYLIRIIILRKLGFEATGLYQSAWALGGLYVGFILQAMAADFYPRLTANANDNAACNRIVNEQARVGLLLAGPGVTATLTFAPIVVALFYSAKFHAAIDVLRWICLGTALQVITWPLGYIILAKGKQGFFFWSELAWGVVYIGISWLCVGSFGLSGAGIAFFLAYVFHVLLVYPIARHLSGFAWSKENKQTALLSLSVMAAVFYAFHVLPLPWAVCFGTIASFLSGVYSTRVLVTLIPTSGGPAFLRRLLPLLRSALPNSARAD